MLCGTECNPSKREEEEEEIKLIQELKSNYLNNAMHINFSRYCMRDVNIVFTCISVSVTSKEIYLLDNKYHWTERPELLKCPYKRCSIYKLSTSWRN